MMDTEAGRSVICEVVIASCARPGGGPSGGKAWCTLLQKDVMKMVRNMNKKKVACAGTEGETVREAGFTFLEILVVIIILGLLAAMVAPNVTRKLGGAKQKTASAQIEMLMTSLELYRLDVGRYPAESDGLQALVENPGEDRWDGPYLKKEQIPLDPWGAPFVYVNPGEHGDVDLYSLGLDMQPGGEGENADVVSW